MGVRKTNFYFPCFIIKPSKANREEKDMNNNIKKAFHLFLAVIMALSVLPIMPAKEAKAGVTLAWPVPGHTHLSQGYHDYKAIDISDGSIAGADVVAALSGTVTAIYLCSSQHYGSSHDCNGFGTGLVIRGTDGRYYQYAHMMGNSIPSNVYYGAYVSTGQKIGRVGTTGNSTGYHLQFGIALGNYWNNSGINPALETYSYGSVQQNLSYSNVHVTFANNNNAGFYGQINNPGRAVVTQVGAYIWNASGKCVVSHAENCGLSYSVIYQGLDIVKEALKSGLTPGSAYTYQLWAKAGGKTFYSSKGSFRTTGTAPSSVLKVPSKMSLTSLTTPAKGKLRAIWKTKSGVKGYQIQYGTSSSFRGAKTYTLTKNTYNGVNVSRLKSKKVYYFRVRAYNKVGTKTVYGPWSNVRKVKVK